ncbi:MAG: PRTRC system protein B [Bacteroidetes bacterium]|nr:PRTRC system protein B [Bacteroidota bacterium]
MDMKNITAVFKEIYLPVKALLIHQSLGDTQKIYVEAYDITQHGKPVNAHPLTVNESIALAECLDSSDELQHGFLIPEKIIHERLLFLKPEKTGYAIWYTKPQKVKMLFKKELGIPCGEAFIPALVWKAHKNRLEIFALHNDKRPNEKSELYHAPFFNIHNDGSVCMGTVDIDIAKDTCLEKFISKWELYFWNSYFSHLIGNASPVDMNIVELWKLLVGQENKFPVDILKASGKKLKDIL